MHLKTEPEPHGSKGLSEYLRLNEQSARHRTLAIEEAQVSEAEISMLEAAAEPCMFHRRQAS